MQTRSSTLSGPGASLSSSKSPLLPAETESSKEEARSKNIRKEWGSKMPLRVPLSSLNLEGACGCCLIDFMDGTGGEQGNPTSRNARPIDTEACPGPLLASESSTAVTNDIVHSNQDISRSNPHVQHFRIRLRSQRAQHPITSETKGLKRKCARPAVVLSALVARIDCCQHTYHFACILAWADRENSCPLCKRRFFVVGGYSPVDGVRRRLRSVRLKNQKVDTSYSTLFMGNLTRPLPRARQVNLRRGTNAQNSGTLINVQRRSQRGSTRQRSASSRRGQHGTRRTVGAHRRSPTIGTRETRRRAVCRVATSPTASPLGISDTATNDAPVTLIDTLDDPVQGLEVDSSEYHSDVDLTELDTTGAQPVPVRGVPSDFAEYEDFERHVLGNSDYGKSVFSSRREDGGVSSGRHFLELLLTTSNQSSSPPLVPPSLNEPHTIPSSKGEASSSPPAHTAQEAGQITDAQTSDNSTGSRNPPAVLSLSQRLLLRDEATTDWATSRKITPRPSKITLSSARWRKKPTQGLVHIIKRLLISYSFLSREEFKSVCRATAEHLVSRYRRVLETIPSPVEADRYWTRKEDSIQRELERRLMDHFGDLLK